ncbi:hypothetical protein SLS60_011906 [Paraconiothyrium brasiliense]|uniref:Rhodopsin domain-containing protein n=1 Tax=Paraconiothyrium brasiliense TaxID=300254 RepID=A0ABR3QH75_9PLEO
MAMTISCAAGSFHGIGSKDSVFKLPGNEKYVEEAYFVSNAIGLTGNARTNVSKWFFLFEVFFCFAVIGVKLSIAFMLNRIAGNRKKFVYANYAIVVLCVSVNLASALYIIFQCNPVEAAWDQDLVAEGGHCQNPVYLANVYYMCTAVNIFTDWTTALMPIALLWNVQMNRNTKISVAGILGLGIFTSVSGLIRLRYTIGLTSSVDYLYGVANIVIWGYAEPSLGMIVGNISTLRPLFLRVFNLGTEGSSNPRSNATPQVLGGADRSHPYRSFGLDHELETVAGASTHIRGGDGRSSLSSDGASEKEILAKGGNTNGIVVSRQVEINIS